MKPSISPEIALDPRENPRLCGPVACLNAGTGIEREAAVLVGQHAFGIGLLDQVLPNKGAHDTPVQIGL